MWLCGMWRRPYTSKLSVKRLPKVADADLSILVTYHTPQHQQEICSDAERPLHSRKEGHRPHKKKGIADAPPSLSLVNVPCGGSAVGLPPPGTACGSSRATPTR